jgi:hypothetical protein
MGIKFYVWLFVKKFILIPIPIKKIRLDFGPIFTNSYKKQ